MDEGLIRIQPQFPRTAAALQRTLDQQLNLGGQIYVSNHGAPILDAAFGFAAPSVPMDSRMAIPWLSAGKPVTAIAIAQLVEAGDLKLSDPVATHLPAFVDHGKDSITIEQILTHTAGIRSADALADTLSWEETIAAICAAPLEANWVPGGKAGYSTRAGWFILAEIVQRKRGCNFEAAVSKSVFEPLGMLASSMTFRPGAPFAPIYVRSVGQLKSAFVETSYPRPGSSARGPIRELGWFYESLIGQANRPALARREIIRDFTTRQRVGMYDHTFLHTIDMGFGFIINSNDYGAETVPYGYGRHASPSTFGHSGAQSSCAFADPLNNLVVAWALNQQPGERPHQQRAREINSALYEDLKLG